MKNSIGAVILCGLMMPASGARAQEPILDDEMEKAVLDEEAEKKKKEGWALKLKVGLTGSLNDSQNVVGAEQGTTIQVGGLLEADADFKSGQHEWENKLQLQHAQTKTPQIDSFVKSTDILDLRSTYMYRLLEPNWLGGFGRFKLNTQILDGNLVRAEDVTVNRVDTAGNVTSEPVAAQQAISLTGPFEPLQLRQTLGVFANPVEEKRVTIKTKLGGGSQQIITRGGYVLLEEPAPGELTLKQLDSFVDGGIEAEIEALGFLIEDVLSWNASANVFLPLATSANTNLDVVEQINTELKMGLALKLQSWLNLEYLLNVRRVPLVIEEWQVQNNLLLSASFDLL